VVSHGVNQTSARHRYGAGARPNAIAICIEYPLWVEPGGSITASGTAGIGATFSSARVSANDRNPYTQPAIDRTVGLLRPPIEVLAVGPGALDDRV
jgi:hypothetical protein